MTPALSSADAEALLRASPLAPGPGPWSLQAVPNHRLDPGRRQQFLVISGAPAAFLTIGPDLKDYIARAALLAQTYPGLATAVIGSARQGDRDLLLQEFIAGRPLLECCDSTQVMRLLEQLEQRLSASLLPSTKEAAIAELHQLGDEVLALALWTESDRDFIRTLVLPFLQSRLITATPNKRVSNCDFMSRNLLVGTDGTIRLIDCDHAAETHFDGEDWLRFGYYDDLDPKIRAFVDARVGDRPAWTVYLALRQLVLEARLHRDRRARIDAQRWCREIVAALSTDSVIATQMATLVSPPGVSDPQSAPNTTPRPLGTPLERGTNPMQPEIPSEREVALSAGVCRPFKHDGKLFRWGPQADQLIGVQLFWMDDAGWSETASELIEIEPGPHRLIFSPPPQARQLRIDPLDLPGTATIQSILITEAKSGREYFRAEGSALGSLTPAGDALISEVANMDGLHLVSHGNDPHLYLPPLDLSAGTQIRFEISLSVTLKSTGPTDMIMQGQPSPERFGSASTK